MITTFTMSSSLCYIWVVTQMLEDEYCLTLTNADLLLGVPYYVNAFGVVIFGMIIDRKGHRAEFLILTDLVLVLAHLLGTFLPPSCSDSEGYASYSQLSTLFLVGIAYGLLSSSAWAAMSLVVD